MRHAVFFHRRHRCLVARHRLQPSLDGRDQLLQIREPVRVGLESWIVSEFGTIHRTAEALKLMIEWPNDNHVAILGLEYPGRDRIPRMQTGTSRLDRSF